MNVLESIKVALSAIFANKMRSLLTMLGIIIGISSVITVVAIGEGSQSMIDKEFEQFGAGKAFLYLNWAEETTQKDFLTMEDLDMLKTQYSDYTKAIIPSISSRGSVKTSSKSQDISINAADENYKDISKLQMSSGRFLIGEDVIGSRNVGAINKAVAKEIFGRTNVVGETIDIYVENRILSLTIVGVYEDPKSNLSALGGGGNSGTVYIPYTTLATFVGADYFTGAEITFEKGINLNDVKAKMITSIERRHDTVGKNYYLIQTAEEELESINKITGIITLVISAIAAISLLVGGIGVMNIMFVSVTERTREIGIRKAIGAKRKDILLQFLVESVIVSGIGGVIGTILGISFSLIISLFIKIPPSISLKTIGIAWIFSAGVGVFFGIYPANKASKLDPIDALRYE